jgi:hypothetical protein
MPSFLAGAGVWPLPTFEPPPQPNASSRRSWQRHGRAVTVTNVANNAILACNALSRSFRKVVPFDVHYQPLQSQNSFEARNSSSSQHRLMSHVYRCASRFVSRRGAVASECDDPLFDTNFLQRLRQADLGAYINKPTTQVVPIVASRIALPSTPGAVDLLDILPPHMAARFAAPNPALFRPVAEQPPAPRTRRVATDEEWVATVIKLRAADMVHFTVAPKVVCGVFAVPKDEFTDRFIIDARPANCVFVVPEPVRLPTPDVLAKLVADPSKPLYVAKVDLDNFYHRVRMPEWLWPYFALPPVRAGDIGVGAEFGDDTWVYPCCKTLPMGWAFSVLLAQVAHEHVIDTHTDLAQDDRITAENDPLLDRTRTQVYIDDVIIIDVDPARLRRVQDAYIAAVTRLGFVVKASKVVRPSADGVECIGLLVHGRDHTVGVSAPKLERLCADTLELASRVHCTGDDLAALVGRWTWAMLANRPALACFNAVYRYAECAGGKRFILWESARSELLTAVGLAPLLFSDLGASWFPRVVATDASERGLGVAVTAQAAAPVALGAVAAEEAAVAAATECRWSTIVSAGWRDSEHINVLELRALTTGVKWVCSHPFAVGQRVWVLCDSSVVVGAVSKGRSSSQPVLRRLRHLSAWLLAAGLRLRVTQLPSALNPADEPSRRH